MNPIGKVGLIFSRKIGLLFPLTRYSFVPTACVSISRYTVANCLPVVLVKQIFYAILWWIDVMEEKSECNVKKMAITKKKEMGRNSVNCICLPEFGEDFRWSWTRYLNLFFFLLSPKPLLFPLHLHLSLSPTSLINQQAAGPEASVSNDSPENCL